MGLSFTTSQFNTVKTRLGIDSLSRREKRILAIGFAFLCCIATYHFIIQPYFSTISALEQTIVRKKQELVEMKELGQEYERLKAQEGILQEVLQNRSPNFSLFTFLDKQSAAARIKEHILYMKPSKVENEDHFDESIVEVKLQKVPLNKLVHYLNIVEKAENGVVVSRVSIQSNRTATGFLDAVLQIVTFVDDDE